MNKILLLFAFFCISATAIAQTRTIKGKVTDETGKPVAGASVLVKGTSKGAQTDKDGNFSINFTGTGNAVITISSVGFGTQTIASGPTESLAVQMKHEAVTQEDVVVIGYQTVRRKDLLASVSSISAKDLKDIPINSAAEALNGRLAGVTATTAEGSPDAAIRIRIRGGMSITQDNSPLYIIDGVQIENGLNTISPQDIQSIDVLKDAAATAIYGARGANGVIVITTKSAKPGKLKVTYNGFVGVKFLAKKLPVMSPYDFVVYQSERSRGSSTDSTTFTKNFGTTWDTLANYQNVDKVDWQKEAFGRTGISTSHNINMSGGTNKFTLNFGYTYNEEKAIVNTSNYYRHLLTLKGEYKVNSRFKLGASVRVINQQVLGAGVSDEKGSSYNRLRDAVKYRPFLSATQGIEDADPLADQNVGNGLNLVNPLMLADMEYRKKTTHAYNVTANASYKIMKNLTFTTTMAFDKNRYYDNQYSDSLTPYAIINAARKPVAGMDYILRTTFTNSNVFNYTVNDFRKKHDFSVVVGEETYDFLTETSNQLYRGFPLYTSHNTAFTNLDLGVSFNGYPRLTKSRYTNLSFFGRISYAYKDKYLFSANVRQDGASKFGPGNKWGTFPSFSVAWRAKKESFLENVDFLTDLKFRFGYGLLGNNRIPDYLYISTFSSSGLYYYGLNNQSIIAYYSSGLVNPKLKWESTENKNYGVDISLFNKRIDLSVDYYDNKSKDLLLNVPIASTYGYSTQLQNVGKTSNKGIEAQLGAQIIRKKDLTWSANFNIAFNKNKVLALGVNQDKYFPAASWGVSGQPADYIVRVGDPVGSMWGLVTDGFYKVEDFNYNTTTGVYTLKTGVVNDAAIVGIVGPGVIKFKDLNGDGLVDLNNDRQIIGDPNPKFTGGLSQQVTYKNWDLSAFVNFSYGNDIYNANKIEFTNGYSNNSNMLNIMQGHWKVVTASGQTAQWISGNNYVGIAPDQLAALNAGATIWQPIRSAGAFYPHSWAIEDGSFLRINNVTVGYTFPAKTAARLHMSRLRLYLTGNNLAVFTKYTGYDPEVNVRYNNPVTPGLDYSAYPKSRSFIFGINASF